MSIEYALTQVAQASTVGILELRADVAVLQYQVGCLQSDIRQDPLEIMKLRDGILASARELGLDI